MRSTTTIRALAAVLALALVATACGSGDTADTTTTTEASTTTRKAATTLAGAATTTEATATTTTSGEATTEAITTTETVIVYLFVELRPGFPEYPVLTPVAMDVEVGEGLERAALQALVAGPTEAMSKQDPALTTEIPEGTRLLGVSIDDGLASVDLSGEFEAEDGSMAMYSRLAQVTYTATRFPSIEAVHLHIDGKDRRVLKVQETFSGQGVGIGWNLFKRLYFGAVGSDSTVPAIAGLLPEVLVEAPAWWETVTSPVTVEGTTTPDTELTWELLDDDGLPLASGETTADTDGSFSVEVPFELDRSQVGNLFVSSDDVTIERAIRLDIDR